MFIVFSVKMLGARNIPPPSVSLIGSQLLNLPVTTTRSLTDQIGPLLPPIFSTPSTSSITGPPSSAPAEPSISQTSTVVQPGQPRETPPVLSSASSVAPNPSRPTAQSVGTNTSSPPVSTSNSPSAGLVAGIVIGSVAAVALIGIFVLLYLRHRKNRSNGDETVGHASVEQVGDVVENEKGTAVDTRLLEARYQLGEEMITNANRWELDDQVRQRLQGPWELPGHVETGYGKR